MSVVVGTTALRLQIALRNLEGEGPGNSKMTDEGEGEKRGKESQKRWPPTLPEKKESLAMFSKRLGEGERICPRQPRPRRRKLPVAAKGMPICNPRHLACPSKTHAPTFCSAVQNTTNLPSSSQQNRTLPCPHLPFPRLSPPTSSPKHLFSERCSPTQQAGGDAGVPWLPPRGSPV